MLIKLATFLQDKLCNIAKWWNGVGNRISGVSWIMKILWETLGMLQEPLKSSWNSLLSPRFLKETTRNQRKPLEISWYNSGNIMVSPKTFCDLMKIVWKPLFWYLLVNPSWNFLIFLLELIQLSCKQNKPKKYIKGRGVGFWRMPYLRCRVLKFFFFKIHWRNQYNS